MAIQYLSDIGGGYYIPIPFAVAGAITTGVKKPVFIAPVAMTIVDMRTVLDAGSGVAVRPSKNKGTSDGTQKTGITTSTSSTAQTLSLSAGDTLGINVTNAGTSASDLSVTFWARVG